MPKMEKTLKSWNRQSGYRDGIWHYKMCHANNEKQKMSSDGRNRSPKPRKDRNTRRKGNLQLLGNIGCGHRQTKGDERKN